MSLVSEPDFCVELWSVESSWCWLEHYWILISVSEKTLIRRSMVLIYQSKDTPPT